MHIDRRFLNWGLFFILLGAVPLAVQQNLISRDVVARAWQLWPLFIIGAGVGLVLRRTSLNFVGGLIAAATAGLILGGVVAVGLDFSSFSCGGNTDKPFQAQQGSLGGRATVNVEFNCGDLGITTAAGDAWNLSGSSSTGSNPRIDSSSDHVTFKGDANVGGFFGFGERQTWSLVFPTNPTLDVDLQLNAGRGTLGLGGARLGSLEVEGNASQVSIDLSSAVVQRLDLQFNAGSAKVRLPSLSLTGQFQANAGSISFCVPDGVAVRITTNENITAANNFAEQGLTKSGNTWQSATYGTATNRIDLSATANAGALTLNPKEGC
jgi:hypothetical protein